MNKALTYFLRGQIYAVVTIVVALLLSPDGLRPEVGLSDLTALWQTALPYTAGLLAMVAYTILALRALPASAPRLFKVFMALNLGGWLSLIATPYGYRPWLTYLHIWFAFILFIIQLLAVISAALSLRTRKAWLLLALTACMLAMAATYWTQVRELLIYGQLAFQVSFALTIGYAFQQLGGHPKRPLAKLKLASQQGFTIIELMIATTVFSSILLLCSLGVVYVGRSYNKGLISARTQETARTLMDDVSRAIQFSGGPVATTPATVTDGTPYVFCVDNERYSVVTDRQVKDNPADGNEVKNAVVRDTLLGCNSSSPALPLNNAGFSISSVPGARDLVAQRMRVAKLQVTHRGNNLYEVVVRIVYGESDLLDASHDNCLNVRAGSQFCAVSELSTIVEKRL